MRMLQPEMGSGIENLTDMYSLWNLHGCSQALGLKPYFVAYQKLLLHES